MLSSILAHADGSPPGDDSVRSTAAFKLPLVGRSR